MDRFEYVLELDAVRSSEVPLGRAVQRSHAEVLAQLMLDAYRGTVDYHDETIDDARAEVGQWLESGGELESSYVLLDASGEARSACLTHRGGSQSPLIGYVMTRSRDKRCGLARRLLAASLDALSAAGDREVWAWITDGNVASEQLFLEAGFRRVTRDP